MAELTISSDEIRSALERYISSYRPDVTRQEVGTVADAGDGIAHVEGLPSAMTNELLEFEDGTLGVALNLDVREIGVVVLGEYAGIEEGQQAARLCALNLIAHLRTALDGDLDRAVRCVRIAGYVNSVPDFVGQSQVINGASDLFVEIFGEAGRHTRMAVGVSALPYDVAVEVEAVFEVL